MTAEEFKAWLEAHPEDREAFESPYMNTFPDRSIAVLPFVNMSADRENEYFSDGMTEEIINALANIEGLTKHAESVNVRFK